MSAFLFACILLAAAAVVASWFLIPRLVEAYARHRDEQWDAGPETNLPAELEPETVQGALRIISGASQPHLRLSNQSRSIGNHRCQQECLAKIEESPEACIVGSMVRQWYDGTSCASCGRPLGNFRWYEQRPAALSPEGVPVDWDTITLERLPQVMATHRPLCRTCHTSETFRRGRSRVVTFRPTHIRSVN